MHGMLFVNSPGRSKVNDLDHVIIDSSEMDVLRLDITMDNVLRMKVCDCRDHLTDDFGCLHFRELLFSRHSFIQSTTLAHFVHEIDFPVVFIHLDDLADIWVIKLLQKLNFVEQLPAFTKFEIFLSHDFDGSCHF